MLYWQPVRVINLVDDDLNYLFKDIVINDETGLESNERLNSIGASVYNEVLSINPLGWGK